MAKKRIPSTKVNFRLHPTLHANVKKRIKERDEDGLSTYVRALIEKDLQDLPTDDRLTEIEAQISANHREVTRSLRYLHMAVRVHYALFEEGLKLLLGFPLATKDMDAAVLAQGNARLAQVLKRSSQTNFQTFTAALSGMNQALEKALKEAGVVTEIAES